MSANGRLVTLTIDGRRVEVPEGTLVVEAAKKLDTHVPVYCYHPKMEPVGLCRICLVEIEKMPKLQIACATRATDGMVVHTTSPKVAEARRGVLEFLLLNHPLDCPICDKGGECDLQDFAMSYGPGQSRLTEPKLHKPKRVDLGPTIVLDEERCILCRRCTRFDGEIAREYNLVVVERGHHSLIATRDGTEYASYFSGNTTEICPVGALTSKAYRFRARPWDLAHADSVCTQCSVGCNFRIDSRFGRIMRTFTRENPGIDDGWICDRGRYTFNYLYEPSRLRAPLVKQDGDFREVLPDEAIALAAGKLAAAAKRGRVGVIGGGRLSDEEAYALQAFARGALDTNNVDYRVHSQKFASPASAGARLADLDDASLIVMFGAASPEEAPILDLRVRRAVARGRAKLICVGPYLPDFAVPALFVRRASSEVADLLRQLADSVHHGTSDDAAVDELARALTGAEKIVGIHDGRDPAAAAELERLMATLARFDHQVGILVIGSQGNARGAEAAGCVPNLLPGYAPAGGRPGLTTLEMLRAAADGELDALLVAGANPALTFPDGALARAALAKVFLVVADQALTETAAHADVVFAAAAFAEKRGHVTNLEGRRQEFQKAVEPPLRVLTDAQIISELSAAMGAADAVSDDPDVLFAALHSAETAGAMRTSASLARPRYDEPRNGAADGRSADDLTVIPVSKLYAGGGAAAHDPGLAPMRPAPSAVFHPDDARRLEIESGDRVSLAGPGGSIVVAARISTQAPAGALLVARDLPEAPVNRLTTASGFGRARVQKITNEVSA